MSERRITTLSVVGFIIILSLLGFKDIRKLWVKSNSDYVSATGTVKTYYVPPNKSKGVVLIFQYGDQMMEGWCTTGYCRTLKVGDTVKLRIYIDDPEIFDVLE